MKEWIKTRSVRLPFGVALLLTSFGGLIAGIDESNGNFEESAFLFVTQAPLKDILVNAIGGFLGGLALLWVAVGRKGFLSLRTKLSRPTVQLVRGRAPANIFTGLELGAPAQWIQQEFGAPTRMRNGWWGYRFSDALVSLTFGDDESLESIAVALTDADATFDFPTWYFDMPPLGKATLGDLKAIEGLDLQFEQSNRHRALQLNGREGPKGAWHYIAFGALNPDIPGPLLPSNFEWHMEESILIGDPKNVMINWAAISSREKIDTFPWDFGIVI